MRILVLGGDGYLGWPTAMAFAAAGHQVTTVDNYLRRNLAMQTSSQALIPTPDLPGRAALFESLTGKRIDVEIADCSDYRILSRIVMKTAPEVVIHYAEQPSAPYSMRGFDEARLTLNNNLNTTFALIWALIEHAPDCHLIKLGTMGEYGTPNIDIEEGWLDVSHNGRTDRFLFPRQSGSLYHTTKILDTDLLWFYVRTHGLRVTDLMQGPVYGLVTPETELDPGLVPNFHYDDIFGTVLNRFLVQAVIGMPLTVYGKGGQTRGYLNLVDSLQCVAVATRTPAKAGELRVLNQFVEQLSVNDLASRVIRAGNQLGLAVEIQQLDNPRKEAEDHYYNAKHKGLLDLGLQPHFLTDEVLVEMLKRVRSHAGLIDKSRILPRVRWRRTETNPSPKGD